MSTFRTPVGPQPPQVYWRRRLMVGLGVVAVIVVIALIIFRPGGDGAGPSADPSGTPAASGAPSAAPVAEGEECKPSVLSLEAVTDADSYAAGVQPQISMRVTNNGAVMCTFDMSASRQLLTITSGSEQYWSSADCQKIDPSAAPAVIELEPNDPKTTPAIAWDRTRSAPSTCDAQRKAVPAGGASYHLSVAVGELESEKTKQFILN